MALIVKCPPPAVGLDFMFGTDVRPVGDVAPAAGDEVFVWTSESARGQGLAMRGTIESARLSKVNRKASLRIRVNAAAPPGSLTSDDLRPHRDSDAPGPLPKLAGKILKNTLNKVAALDADEARHLRGFFGPPVRPGRQAPRQRKTSRPSR
jgi:hypothetical protein